MAKEKRKVISRIIDFAAAVITAHDKAQIKIDKAIVKVGHGIISGMAGIINGYDLFVLYVDRGCLIVQYHVAKFLHREGKVLSRHKHKILGYFAGGLLVAIAMVAVYNYATAYEYSYNGKILGYVKDQDEVLKILDVAGNELTKEYGTRISINPDTDIEFNRVVSLDKETDDVDMVLKKFTYMSDMQADGYGIFINDLCYTIVKDKATANSVLDKIKGEYTQKKDKTVYEKVDFKEKVKIKKTTVRLGNIKSLDKAVETIETGARREETYTVKPGDTYSGICESKGITMKELKANNPDMKEDSLMPDQKLIITKAASALTVVTVEKSTFAEVVKFKTKYEKSDSMYKGDSTVTQKGSNGKQVVTAKIIRENGEEIDRKVLSTETITEAVTEIITKGTQERPKTAPTGSFANPLRSGYTLSSEYGWRWGRMHEGIDMACGTGTPIYAADGGTVVQAGWFGGYGNFVEISHGNGVTTRYGHCNSIDVSAGQQVYKGQKIAEVGNTGNSFGSHLHFEIKINGSTVNPLSYI